MREHLADTTTDELLEREPQLAMLRALAGRAGTGVGSVALVRGAAGSGKTRLLRAARDRATADGLQVLTARGGDLERAFAFGVARQLFEPALEAASPAQRERILAGAAALAAPLAGVGSFSTAPAGNDAEHAVQHGLYWLTVNLAARRPLLLCVDDAHWADAPSLRWLVYLARRLDGLPVLLALGVRSGEAEDAQNALGALVEAVAPVVIEPPPLSVAAVGTLVARGLRADPDPDFAAACHAATQGNAFLATELVAYLAAEGIAPVAANAGDVERAGTPAVATGVLRRVARVGPAAEALVAAVALLGRPELRLAAQLADLGLDAAARAADRLGDVAVLAPGRPLDFVHPIVRHAVYGSLTAAVRADGHRRAARMLADEGSSPTVVAGHLLHCEPAADAWTVTVLRDAAAEALAGGAPDVAVTLLARAAREPPDRQSRPAVLAELGRAELRAGDRGDQMASAIEHYSQARASAVEPLLRARIARELAVALWGAERTEEAVALLVAEADRLEPGDPDLALGLQAHLVAAGWLATPTSAVVAGRLNRFLPLKGETRAQRLAAGAQAFEELVQGAPPDTVGRLADLALSDLAADAGDELPPPWPIVALTCIDRFAAALQACDAQIAIARERGALRAVIILTGFRAAIGLRRGALRDAETDARGAFDLAATRGFALDLPATRAFLIDTLIEQGRLAEAAQAVADAAYRHDVPPHIAWNWFRHARGNLRLATGDATGALADHLACGEWMADWGGCSPAAIPWRSAAALAQLALGRQSAALALAEEEVAQARGCGIPRAIARALRVAGLTRGGTAGEALLAEAVATLATLPQGNRSELELAHAVVDLGAAQRRSGQRRAGREQLTTGMDLAHRCGAAPLVDRAREELLATGARPRRPASTGRDALTPSELRVAARAAAGLTNREIAQELFITPRTVEVHLTHIFSKLDIRSRTGLAAALETA